MFQMKILDRKIKRSSNTLEISKNIYTVGLNYFVISDSEIQNKQNWAFLTKPVQ